MSSLWNGMRIFATIGLCLGFASNASAYRSMVSSCPDTSSCTSCHRDNICDPYNTTTCTDNDNDGFAVEGGSCGEIDFNDRNASAYPGATEICDDGVDNDGNGLIDYDDYASCEVTVVCTDLDQDGYYVEGERCGTLADFNDNEASAYPGAPEICTDGVDNDGNGLVDSADPGAENCSVVCSDLDGDGYSTDGGSCGPVDCNDEDAAINPGAEELCSDGIDNNCNAVVDNADENAVGCPVDCTDLDADGYSIEGGSCGAIDCDDANNSVNPAAAEICDDGMDNNCNNLTDSSDRFCQSDDREHDRDNHHDSDDDDDEDEDEDRNERKDDRRDSDRRSHR